MVYSPHHLISRDISGNHHVQLPPSPGLCPDVEIHSIKEFRQLELNLVYHMGAHPNKRPDKWYLSFRTGGPSARPKSLVDAQVPGSLTHVPRLLTGSHWRQSYDVELERRISGEKSKLVVVV